MKKLFTLIPKVDELLAYDRIIELLDQMPRTIIMEAIREETDLIREKIKDGKEENEIKRAISSLVTNIEKRANKQYSYKLKRVINATGVVIHTNLGRSLLNEDIIENIKNTSLYYSNLEFDLETGIRGSRYSHLEDLITRITGGESSMVVNNNAAAVMLALSSMCKDKEVIVSRGELVEIGGSFRVPDVMEQSGGELVAVGTTNKTHIWDYENAINENTGALLKVHTSNYRIVGFTSSVDSTELKELKDKYNIPLIEDLGSGVLIDLSKYGISYEPTVQDSLNNGVDIVTFSGDKLLGGPQAGIIVGKKQYIDKMKKNPLTRAFRVDKLTIAALEASIRLFLNEEEAIKKIPSLKMITMPIDEIEDKAKILKNLLDNKNIDSIKECEILDDYSQVGGGSLPLERLRTKCLVISIENISIQKFEANLRNLDIPIIPRVYKERVYFDLRTVGKEELNLLADGIEEALNS